MPTAPPRPNIVPPGAIWAGGVDGGSFIECDVERTHNLNRCLAYHDHSGNVEGGGFFRLSGLNRAARQDELRYAGFDGEKILLAGGMLVAVEQFRPFGVPGNAVFANGLFIACKPLVGVRTDCDIYRPDGHEYFRGAFIARSEMPSRLKYKFFDLSSQTIYLESGGELSARH